MRVLVVSNYYPPHFVGGYELGCLDVLESLKKRGHAVTVLTSDYKANEGQNESGVWRVLPLQSETYRPGLLKSMVAFARVAFVARPDVVYFWNQAGLSFWLAPLARLIRLRCVFFVSDTSFVAWRIGAFLRRWLTSNSESGWVRTLQERFRACLRGSMLLEGRLITQGQRCEFASEFLRDLSLSKTQRSRAETSSVIHWGIDPDRFQVRGSSVGSPPLKLLYVGQVIPEKGVHTAIEAAAIVLQRLGNSSVTLTIAGGTSKPHYLADQRNRVTDLGLEGVVQFLGKLPRAHLPALYYSHDILVFPSVWDEPFAITPLEAMASGLPVVATGTGGSSEIFKDRDNCLVFPAGDSEGCAAAIMELHANSSLYECIRLRGRDFVLSTFSLERMVDQIEDDLKHIADNPSVEERRAR